MAITSTILSKLKDISSKQKRKIISNLEIKGELPLIFQIIVALMFWVLLFVILLVSWNPASRWIIIIIAIVGAYGAIELVNFLGKKYLKKEVEEDLSDLEAIEEEISSAIDSKITFTQNTILLNNLYTKGGIILGKSERLKYSLTPLIVLTIDFVASGSSSIFSSISVPSLQKMSLKYNCSIIDTSHYEVIILKGTSKTCRVNSLKSTIKQLNEQFYNEAFDLITELQRDKRIEFEKPSLNILSEIFPNFKNVIMLDNEEAVQVEIIKETGLETEMEKQLEVNQVAEIVIPETQPLSLEEEENLVEVEPVTEEILEIEEEEEISESPTAVTDRKMLKEVLYSELDYSLESFLTASKNYYKKAVENILQKNYGIKLNKFLKLVLYFCDKRDIPFFFSSYSYLLKIIEFMDVELPSSSDIENYIDRLTEDYVTVKIPDDLKEKLEQFLDERYNNGSTNSTKVSQTDDSKMSSIPAPPSKEEVNSVTNGVK